MSKQEVKPLNFKIDVKSSVPVYEQIKRTIKLAILSGFLQKDDKIISIRELSEKLRINPNTTAKVFYQLDFEGYIYSLPGRGYFVNKVVHPHLEEKRNLFSKIVESFISQASDLGFSIDEMVEEIEKRRSGKPDPSFQVIDEEVEEGK